MAEYEKRLREILALNGCTFVRRGKGDHDVWFSPINNRTFPVPIKVKSRHTANAILKQSGSTYRFR